MGLLNIALAVMLVLSVVYFEPSRASRMLHDEEEIAKKKLGLQSLQRGDLPPSGASGCTYIPGTGGSSCPLNGKHHAGHVLSHATAYPRLTVQLGVATNQK
ncbi:uncharacterized protein LOC112492397 [Ziziphus jujuba]|uniref:Uncharacterized protein LOC112492397 n=2 Tax=Ziziphus jujuba TaxID=326968 RepID=A0A6P6GC74_ZIZJJ|nr:uncharacterized protein LOC112492397 [Ziziphus jujuba]KAH7522159.1 hypothetical protein FEM48_Zijuj07G0108700 [Ziziphus jujuba var. spinosa]